MSMIFSGFRVTWLNSGQLSACGGVRTDAPLGWGVSANVPIMIDMAMSRFAPAYAGPA
jgi:hypothetical protein